MKEIRIIGGHLGPHCWPKAIDLISNGQIPVTIQLISSIKMSFLYPDAHFASTVNE